MNEGFARNGNELWLLVRLGDHGSRRRWFSDYRSRRGRLGRGLGRGDDDRLRRRFRLDTQRRRRRFRHDRGTPEDEGSRDGKTNARGHVPC
jgi:hypothetical protein